MADWYKWLGLGYYIVFKTSSGVKPTNTNNLQVANSVQGSYFGWMRATLVFDNSLRSPKWSSSFIISTSRCIWSLSYLKKISAGAVVAVSRSSFDAWVSLSHMEAFLLKTKHTQKNVAVFDDTRRNGLLRFHLFPSHHHFCVKSCDYICRKNYFFLAWNMLKKIARDRFPSPPSVSKGYHYYYNRSL